jgi:hypothetical protein
VGERTVGVGREVCDEPVADLAAVGVVVHQEVRVGHEKD